MNSSMNLPTLKSQNAIRIGHREMLQDALDFRQNSGAMPSEDVEDW